MRILFGTALLVCCLAAGCSSSQKGGAGGAAVKPFTGLPSTDRSGGPAAIPTSNSENSGSAILAGQVLDRYRQRVGGVAIQVVDLQEGAEAAGAVVKAYADDQGYFFIPGLKAGHTYKLTAEQKDGDRVLVASTKVSPPDARVALYLAEDNSATPRGTVSADSEKSRTTGPAATIQPPVRKDGEGPPTGPEGRGAPSGTGASIAPPPGPPGPTPPDPSRAVRIQDGFARTPPATVNVPGPAPQSVLPPTPGTPWGRPPTAPATPAPAPSPSAGSGGASPTRDVPVPSCLLVGRKLENFALYNIDGRPWVWQRDRVGRVVLLDFWFSTCGPCMRAIPELRELQRRYGSQGLQVVGIAYEEGSRTEQAQKVINVRARLGINYVTLLGGNGTGPRSPCPVKTQFQVTSFPTLVLLDEQGNILWRNREGVNSEELRELDFLIRQRLGVAHR